MSVGKISQNMKRRGLNRPLPRNKPLRNNGKNDNLNVVDNIDGPKMSFKNEEPRFWRLFRRCPEDKESPGKGQRCFVDCMTIIPFSVWTILSLLGYLVCSSSTHVPCFVCIGQDVITHLLPTHCRQKKGS